MANKKNNQKKGKKKNKSPKRPPPPRGTLSRSIVPSKMSGKQNMTAVHTVCGMLDPFCPHAHGMKIHDENSTRSSTYRSLNLVTMSTNASGAAMSYFCINPSQFGFTGTVTGVTTGAWVGLGPNTFHGMCSTQVSGWRAVSFGVRIFTPLPAMTAAGVVTVTEIQGVNPSSSSTWGCGSTSLGQNVKIFPLANCNIHWSGRGTGINGNIYQNDIANQDYDAFTAVLIGLTGSVISLPALTVEVIVNYEFIAIPNTALASASTAAAPAVPALMTARANAGSMIDTLQNVQSTAAYSADVLKTITQTGLAVNNAASQLGPAFRTAKALGGLAGLML